MGKKEKEHRKKVAKRNETIKVQQKKLRNAQEEFLKKLIEREREAGKFDNNVMESPAMSPDLGMGPLI